MRQNRGILATAPRREILRAERPADASKFQWIEPAATGTASPSRQATVIADAYPMIEARCRAAVAALDMTGKDACEFLSAILAARATLDMLARSEQVAKTAKKRRAAA